MLKVWRWLAVAVMLAVVCAAVPAQVVVLQQAGFPAVDTPALPPEALQDIRGKQAVDVAGLPSALTDSHTKLLVLPYGSGFPEADWPAIRTFLQSGGNLLTLGGRPFTRPVYRSGDKWELRSETYAFARELFLSDYQSVGASAGLQIITNRDLLNSDLPPLGWTDASSVVIRLSDEGSSSRVGASGTPDSDLRTLLWGVKDGRKIAAPVIEIDHFRNNFVGGRWVMLNCTPGADGFSAAMLQRLASVALQGATEIRITPENPLYVAGETPAVHIDWKTFSQPAPPTNVTAEITVSLEGQQESKRAVEISNEALTPLPRASGYPPGFHTVTATFKCGSESCGTVRTGFWIRDRSYLLSGPRVSLDHDYFQIDGRQTPVIGTTYMDSKAQRLFLRYPNPYLWNEDLRQISQDGLNMLRTGLWTDWDEATGGTGIATEHTLRTIEAFLMTARKYNLPVQFNLFAFMPEVFGGGNPYLDPEALRREHAFVASVVARFANVPFLIWDLMNEPSFDNPKRFFGTKPNGDDVESAQWTQWLLAKYGSREHVASLWNIEPEQGALPVPDEGDFYGGSGGKVLSVFDFNLFAQEKFTEWVKGMRQTIRDSESAQLITVGTDEGGGLGSLSPTYFNTQVDFTTMHSWWLYDDLLWDSLVAKQHEKPMLVQETGVMFEPDLAGRPRRTMLNEADLLERKIGIALGTGAGAIEWLWNINSLMQSQQEVTIGALRWDGTEKPEARVLRDYGHFVAESRDYFLNPQPENVVVLTSQALQYSPLSSLATAAQQRAVRVLNYQCQSPARVVSENNVSDVASAALVVLPSPQALQESTWKALLTYVDGGGNVLITGPMERDEHWQRTHRLEQLGINGEAASLNYRGAEVDLGSERVNLAFGIDIQKHAETLVLADGKTYLEIKRGKGQIFIVANPVELSDSPDATEAVYRHVLSTIGISTTFTAPKTSPSVLIRPRMFEKATLYLLESESSRDEVLNIEDKRSGAHIKVKLPAQRTKLVLVDVHDGHILASYGDAQ